MQGHTRSQTKQGVFGGVGGVFRVFRVFREAFEGGKDATLVIQKVGELVIQISVVVVVWVLC